MYVLYVCCLSNVTSSLYISNMPKNVGVYPLMVTFNVKNCLMLAIVTFNYRYTSPSVQFQQFNDTDTMILKVQTSYHFFKRYTQRKLKIKVL